MILGVAADSVNLFSIASLLGLVGIQFAGAAGLGKFSPATAIASTDTEPKRHYPAVRIRGVSLGTAGHQNPQSEIPKTSQGANC